MGLGREVTLSNFKQSPAVMYIFQLSVIASVTNLYLGYLSSQQHTLGIRQYNLIKKKGDIIDLQTETTLCCELDERNNSAVQES